MSAVEERMSEEEFIALELKGQEAVNDAVASDPRFRRAVAKCT